MNGVPKIDIDAITKEITEADSLYIDNIYRHIAEAQDAAIRHGFEVNTVLVNKSVAISQGFFATDTGFIEPAVFGLKVQYTETILPHNANFMLAKSYQPDAYEALKRENAELKEKIEQLKEIIGE